MEIITKNVEETQGVARKVAKSLTGGEVLALVGELGSGKTTFVQGLAKGLGIKKRVISPTFILMRRYDIKVKSKKLKVKSFYHVDLYRLEKELEREISHLGLRELWGIPQNIVAIEWAEKIRNFLPQNTIWINFKTLDENSRKINMNLDRL